MSEGQPGNRGQLALERRRTERISLEMWVEEATQNERYFRRAGNLSRGGMSLDHTIPLPQGTVVHLTFTLPGGTDSVTVAGEIVSSVNANELRMSVKFVNVEPECQRHIDRYLASIATETPPAPR